MFIILFSQLRKLRPKLVEGLVPSHTASEKCVGRGRKWLSALPSGQSQSGWQGWRKLWGYKSAGLGGQLNVGAEGEG